MTKLEEQIKTIEQELIEIARISEDKLVGEYSIVIGKIAINECEEPVLLFINDTDRYFNVDFDANIDFKEDLAEKISKEIKEFLIKESFKYQQRDTMLETLKEVKKEIEDI